MLESGSAREFVERDILKPYPMKRTLRHCNMLREGKEKFWLYSSASGNDDSQFLLSAKFVDGAFYISQYEDFPWEFTGLVTEDDIKKAGLEDMADALGLVDKPMPIGASHSSAKQHQGFCQVLKLENKRFTLYSKSCEYCDDVLGRFSCGPPGQGARRTGGYDHERQILGYISHGNAWVGPEDDGCLCNTVSFKVPTVYKDMTRCVWCPRNSIHRSRSDSTSSAPAVPLHPGSPHSSPGKTIGTPPGSPVRRLKRSMSYSDKDICTSSTSLRKQCARLRRMESAPDKNDARSLKDTVALQTLLPRYDHGSGSLKMRFYDDRVRVASSKNMVFNLKSDSDSDRGCVLQFGKLKDKTYCVDFSFPLAPVQAFAVGLSLFKWQAKKHK